MGEVKTLYAVALTFSGEIADMFGRLRKDYQQYMKYTIVPHITLVYPFAPGVGMSIIVEKLEEVAKRTSPFTLVMSGIEYFEGGNNVVYVAIAIKQSVKELHADLIRSLNGLIQEEYTDGNYNLEKFTPHMTIGEKIPEDVFPGIKQRLSSYKLYHESEIADFSLFSEENGIWEPKRVFELAGRK